MGDYEATLYCSDDLTRIPDEYFVYLHFGYSLEQHKQEVGGGADLDLPVSSLFPETANYGHYYFARLDDAGLAAVRADIGVDMVECNFSAYLID